MNGAAGTGTRLTATLAGVIAALSLASCSSSGDDHSSSAAPSPAATRWWSNAAASAGSTIDPKNPGAAAANLQPSRPAYCAMLKDTVSAGQSILPGITSTDPALLTAAQAFVAEIEKVAPSEVASQWQTISTAVVALVKAGGSTSALASIDVVAVSSAASAVTTDAQQNCNVDLSSITGGISLPSPSPS